MAVSWYQYGYFWRRGDADGDDTPQDRGDGTGDLIFHTMTKIVIDGDTSDWAVASFFTCANLLKQRKRYPDEFLVEGVAPNMVAWYINKWCGGVRYKYRPQSRMSRDPFIAFGACYTHLLGSNDGVYDKLLTSTFLQVRIPLHLQYSFCTMMWWNWLKRYAKGTLDKKPHYVLRLDYFQAIATKNIFERYYENDFYKNTYSRRSG